MLQKNKGKNIFRKFDGMVESVYNKRFIIAIVCATMLLLFSCKKTIENITENSLKKQFEDNILNKTFIVDLATDTNINKTSEYTGYDFVLSKTTSYFDGPMTGTKAGVIYTGTWSVNEDFSKLVININSPSIPIEFIFLNRAWKFTKKALPVMELAPWGTTDPKVLHMRRL
jgi:hypothetical protein